VVSVTFRRWLVGKTTTRWQDATERQGGSWPQPISPVSPSQCTALCELTKHDAAWFKGHFLGVQDLCPSVTHSCPSGGAKRR
jgi:hypothetical protein